MIARLLPCSLNCAIFLNAKSSSSIRKELREYFLIGSTTIETKLYFLSFPSVALSSSASMLANNLSCFSLILLISSYRGSLLLISAIGPWPDRFIDKDARRSIPS